MHLMRSGTLVQVVVQSFSLLLPMNVTQVSTEELGAS